MGDFGIKALNKIEFVTEIMLGISLLTKRSISDLFNEENVDSFVKEYDILVNEGYEYIVYKWINSRIDPDFNEDSVNNYEHIEQFAKNHTEQVKTIIALTDFINYRQFLSIFNNYHAN